VRAAGNLRGHRATLRRSCDDLPAAMSSSIRPHAIGTPPRRSPAGGRLRAGLGLGLGLRLGLGLGLVLAACSSGAPPPATFAPVSSGPLPSASIGSRPSSPAVVSIVQPTSGEVVTGNTVHIVLTLSGASITTVTSTTISPTEGHIHLYVDNVLVSMNYGLTQDLPVQPGTYVLKAEFVAADHYPFDPRVWSPEVYFTVK